MSTTEERMQKLREAAIEKKRLELEKEAAYFERISSGIQWKVFKILSIYCALLGVVMAIETVFDGKEKSVPLSNLSFYEGAINHGDDWYTPIYTELTGYLDTSFKVIYSPIFQAPKYLKWTSAYQDSKTPLTYTDYTEWRYNSVYGYYVYIQIVLLIPLGVFLYKRPTPLFKFARMLCLVLIFPAGIYLFFVTIGVADLLPFGL